MNDEVRRFKLALPRIPPASSLTIPVELTASTLGSFTIAAGIYEPSKGIRFLGGQLPPDMAAFPAYWDWTVLGNPPPGYIVLYENFGGSGSTAISLGDGTVAHYLPEDALGKGSPDGLLVHPYALKEPTIIIRPPGWTPELAQERLSDFHNKYELRNGKPFYDNHETNYVNMLPEKLSFPDLNCAAWVYYFWQELNSLSPGRFSDAAGELYDKLHRYWWDLGVRNEPYKWWPAQWHWWDSLGYYVYGKTYDLFLSVFNFLNGIGSFDPNLKTGSQGIGELAYISCKEPLLYTISFENQETATAPAQEVIVTDQLDIEKMDLTTLSLRPMTFGDKQVVPPPGRSSFAADVDLRPGQNLIVRVEASLNPNTGVLSWRFTSIDPATGNLPEDPRVGFLPPNVTPPEGDGSVLFSVMPKSGLPTGTEIRNQAEIKFDANAPILTPEWMNTLDNSKPTSQVMPLAAIQSTTDFLVEWVGTDEGAGIKNFTIFVSENDGPATVWLSNTPDTSRAFPGSNGNTYAFYSVARDQAGNVEDAPQTPDASTTVFSCADDSTSKILVSRSGFRLNRATGRYVQTVTLKNISALPIQGPVSLVLDGLSSNATLFGASGTTGCATPLGSSYSNVNIGADGQLSPGETATVLLEFRNPTNQGIAYSTRILTGTSQR